MAKIKFYINRLLSAISTTSFQIFLEETIKFVAASLMSFAWRDAFRYLWDLLVQLFLLIFNS